MALYHANIKSFSRGKGESAVAAAAYRAGLDLTDTKTRIQHRYSNRKGVVAFHMLAPAGAPDWCRDARVFWDANDAWEDRANARVARELEVSLPHELDPAQREALAIALGQELVDRFEVVVLVAIHEPSDQGDQRNHHTHLLMSARKIGPNGFRERAGAEFDARGGQGANAIREVREWVGEVINAHLRAAGVEARVDHRSLRDQAIAAKAIGDLRKAFELNRAPTKHVGKVKTARSRAAATTLGANGVQLRKVDPMQEAMTRAAAEGRLVATPSGHDHAAAMRDMLREQQSAAASGVAQPSGAAAAPRGKSPSPLDTPQRREFSTSALGHRVARIFRLARAQGADAEILNAEKELIENWLESQREAAQAAIDALAAMGCGFEPQFTDAISSLRKQRLTVYWDRPLLIDDTEELAFEIANYVASMRRERDAEARLMKAREKLHFAEHERGSLRSEIRINGARRECSAAKAANSSAAKEAYRKRIVVDRAAMVEARERLERKFHITDMGDGSDGQIVASQNPPPMSDEGTQSQSNRVMLKPPKPKRPGQRTSIFH